MILASKSGTLSVAKFISETNKAWTLEIEESEVEVSKKDKKYRVFAPQCMAEALKWSGADQSFIDDFKEDEASRLPGVATAGQKKISVDEAHVIGPLSRSTVQTILDTNSQN